jgi:hypothetical protein
MGGGLRNSCARLVVGVVCRFLSAVSCFGSENSGGFSFFSQQARFLIAQVGSENQVQPTHVFFFLLLFFYL